MPRFSVPMTILATVEIDAPDQQTAIEEASRFIEALTPERPFLHGWNEVTAGHPVTPTSIHRVSEFALEEVGSEAVEEVDTCRSEGCTRSADNGEGWDGYCGGCADQQDA